MGPPCAGKTTTIRQFVNQTPRWQALYVGQMLRNLVASDIVVKQFMERNVPVPSSVTVGHIKKFIAENEPEFLIIDGFPYNEENYLEWKRAMPHCNPKCIIRFNTMVETCRARASKRCRDDDKWFETRYQRYCNESLIINFDEKCQTLFVSNESESEILEMFKKLLMMNF